jgi:flagellar basal body rod protein FlgC
MEFLNRKERTIDLDSGVANLGTGALKIEMCEGTGWIGYKDKDIVLRPGETVHLGASHNPVVISSTDEDQNIVFKVKHMNPLAGEEGLNIKPSNVVAAMANMIKG